MFKANTGLLFVILSMLLFSCSGDENIDSSSNISEDNLIDKINLPDQLGLDSGEVKMFTMPTPLQIATALKIMNVEYDENILLENGNISVASDIDLSLALGMYLTDLGYTTVYNNTQKSLSYITDIQFIMEELPIAMYMNDGFKKRFSNNIDNQDSLCKIILDGYNEANQHIAETQNESLGLLILTGAYIEGLHLASSSNVSTKWADEHTNILIQQKLFLDNFLVLLEGYTNNVQIDAVVAKLKVLRTAFDKMNISFNDKTGKYELDSSVNVEFKNEINLIVSELRNDMITNIQAK